MKKIIKIQTYSGYGNKNKIFCMGRVLIDKEVNVEAKDSALKQAFSIYKAAETDEIRWQKIQYTFAQETDTTYTNTEGFYMIEETIENFSSKKNIHNIHFQIAKEDFESSWKNQKIEAQDKIFFKSQTAKFGVISDIDDTILKTDVMSLMKLKLLYNTLFLKATERLPIKDAPRWYRKLQKGIHNEMNPFFYISHSPWNLYNYLQKFLKENRFPEGPLLLRDFGLKAKDALQDYKNHKKIEVQRILKMYPKLNFILIGDGGEKDAYIYLALKKQFPNRILAIFIYRLGNKAHQSKVEKISEEHKDYFFFVKNGKQAIKISKKLGLINS